MKIISLETKQQYEISPNKNGENISICPECSHNRKPQNKRKKCFSWNEEKKTGYCNNCNAKFVEYKPFKTTKEYKVPEWKNKTELSNKAVKYFESRMISQSTLVKMKIYSDNEYIQEHGNVEVMQFPYFFNEKLVNIKSRGPLKSFKFVSECELIFYNLDSVLKYDEIIITEGEFDCLSFIQIGFENCISVPNGGGKKTLPFLDDYIELFDNKQIYIATDNDLPGIELRNELIRRFGSERCKIVLFKDCKDANEYLIKYGGLELAETIKNAFELPVEGIVNINNQYDDIYNLFLHGLQKGKGILIDDIDKIVSWETSRLAVWTGIPGHGKSEVLDWFNCLLNIHHGWKVAYFSPENYPIKYHYAKLASKIIGRPFKSGYIDNDTFEEAFQYIQENFFFIYPEEDMTFKNIIEKAKYTVKKYGVKILVIDPYNKIEHLREKGETETEYVSRFLDSISIFMKKYDVLVHLVAHPRKMDKDGTKKFERPTLYDINGSANFYNKCDYGISIYRDKQEQQTEIHFLKVKFRHLGEGGTVIKRYNYNNGRYEDLNFTIDQWNNSSYLSKQKTEPEKIEKDENFWNEIQPNTNFDNEPF